MLVRNARNIFAIQDKLDKSSREGSKISVQDQIKCLSILPI